MTGCLVEPAPVSSVAFNGETARYPINREFCVGRTCAAHAAEAGAVNAGDKTAGGIDRLDPIELTLGDPE